MDRTNVRDHADLRQGNVAEEGNLARHIKSHFQHGPLVARAQAQNGQGQADLIIEVAGTLQGAVAVLSTSAIISLVVDGLPTLPVIPTTRTSSLRRQ